MPEVFTGKVEFKNKNGFTVLSIDPDSGFVDINYAAGPNAVMMQLTNTSSFSLGGEGNNWGARLDGMLGDLFLGGSGRVGSILMRDGNGNDIITADAGGANVFIGASGNAGDLFVRDSVARNVFQVDGASGTVFVGAGGNAGDVIVRNGVGSETIRLNGAAGDIVLSNADCAEDFELERDATAEAGTVMRLGDGGVMACDEPYDRRVAGVVSGAGGLRPGIVLGRPGDATARCPLALVGTVYCKADAEYGAIARGDMLTTSATPGHAMRADDPIRAFGAVLGKALGDLYRGRGLVPVLVALQ